MIKIGFKPWRVVGRGFCGRTSRVFGPQTDYRGFGGGHLGLAGLAFRAGGFSAVFPERWRVVVGLQLGAEADALGTAVRVFTGLSTSSNNVRLTQTINAST